MNTKELKIVIEKICPSMLSNDNFMKSAINRYCNGEFINCRTLTDDEYKEWIKLHEVICTATVGQLVKYLKDNFKSNDKLCFMDCVEGCKNDCTYVTKDLLGRRFFYYVKNLKERMCNEGISEDSAENHYPYVKDNDVIVA